MNVTREQFIEKYGDVKVKFTYYYKYSFSYKSEDGKITVGYGGSSDDIYRFTVDALTEYTIKDLGPNWGEYKEGDTVEEFYEYY